MNTEKVAQRIRFFMEKKGVSLADLAVRTGMEPFYIEMLPESGAEHPFLPMKARNSSW